MKPEKIYYQKNFPVAQFIFETIGMGITLEQGDDPEDALNEAKRLVQEYHYKNQQPAGVQQTIKVPAEIPNTHVQPEPMFKSAMQLLKEKQDKEIDGHIEAIKLAENEKTLKLYSKQVERNNDPSNPKHQQLQEAYNNKEAQLKQTV